MSTAVVYDRDALFIENEPARVLDGTQRELRSPATEDLIGQTALAGPKDISRAVASARNAFDRGPWPRLPLEERRRVLRRAADILAPMADKLSELVTQQNGVVIRQRQGAVETAFRHYADMPFPAPEFRASGSSQAMVVQEPVGVVAAVVPWNSPVSVGLGKVLPALLAGCTVVLKPSPETPLQDFVFAEALADAGLPPGALSVVPADRDVSEQLVRDPAIDMVSFTGSTRAGRQIGALCGRNIRRVLLELGGKSAGIVLDDIDLHAAAEIAVWNGVLMNNGESCMAWSRLLVFRKRHDDFVDALRDVLAKVRVGDPLDPTTDVGPLISDQHRQRVEHYICSGVADGASVAYGGGRPSHLERGWYIEPTLLVGVDNSMSVCREEIFGPVVAVLPYDTVDDAVAIANDSEYGLAGAVITEDTVAGFDIAQRIRAGTIGINCTGVSYDTPFGGYKDSGVGRCRGPEGLKEYLEVKTIGLPPGVDARTIAH